jgi:hypothetical protein
MNESYFLLRLCLNNFFNDGDGFFKRISNFANTINRQRIYRALNQIF